MEGKLRVDGIVVLTGDSNAVRDGEPKLTEPIAGTGSRVSRFCFLFG